MKLTSIAALGSLAFLVGCSAGIDKTCNPGTTVRETHATEDQNGDRTVTVVCADGKSWEVNAE